MRNASLEQRKARIAAMGGWKAVYLKSLIETLHELGDVIVPMIFNRTVFLSFMMCYGITSAHQRGQVSAETGGMVIAFTLLWLIADQILSPFFVIFGQVHWGLVFRTDDLTPEQIGHRKEARAALITLLSVLAVLGVVTRVNALVLIGPVALISGVSLGLLLITRGVASLIVSKQTPAE